MKKRWFFLFFKKSILHRKGRVLIASVSITLAVATVTGMLGITLGINEKLGSELKAYGANIMVSPQKEDFLGYNAAENILKLGHVESASGQLFSSVFISRQTVEIIGLDIKSLKDRGWRISGSWPSKTKEIIAGINLKNALKLEKGKIIPLEHEGRKMNFTISGFVERGGFEDSSLIMSLPDSWQLTGLNNRLSAVLVRGKSEKLESIIDNIRNILPETTVKTLRQVALPEKSLLNKIQLLMALVTAVVLFASCISVASTMGANVIERRVEIGLMKAIGAKRSEISLFYWAEALLIGLLGGFAGYILGYLSAQIISKNAFDSYIAISPPVIFVSLALGVMVTLVSAYFPVRGALTMPPSQILRGE